MPMAFDVQSTPSARQAAVPRRILLCYDGSAEAKSGAVVSVADPIYSEPPNAGFTDPGEEQTHRRLLQAAAGDLRRLRVEATTVEQVGPPGRRDPRRRPRRRRPRRGRLPTSRIDQTPALRLVSAEVVVKAQCDVLVVR
jgi:hypothetical protein